ncbi:MAG: glycosyltransferase family 2 protein [Patescibacteria group bacterium]
MNEYPLEITKISHIDNLKDRLIFRLFQIIPGLLSWTTLIFAFLFSSIAPVVVAFFIITFDVFWLMRIIYLSFYQIISLRKMQKNLEINWLEELQKKHSNVWQKIYHIITLPTYKDSLEIITSSLEALLACNYPKEKMIIVLAIEEREGEEAIKRAEKIKTEYGSKFFKFFITIHPKSIEGEVAGKGSNVAWALSMAKEEINKLSIATDDILISNFDIDTKPYVNYFGILTKTFLETKDRFLASYQPIPVYNNNIWDASVFCRIIATSGTFWQMMQQERPEQLVTYSSHSFPFKIFEKVGYPSRIVSDDSNIFWKAYLYNKGKYRAIPLHYPVSMDAVMADGLIQTMINQYKQQRRWAWGLENIPYLFFNFLKDKEIPFFDKLRHSLVILEGFWAWATSALLIFFLGWLPLWLGGENFNITLLSYNLPRLTSYLMTVSMIGMVVGAYISLSILPARPERYNKWKTLSMLSQWLFLPITLILFGSIPALDAQTRLMLNKPLGFWPTEKKRKS